LSHASARAEDPVAALANTGPAPADQVPFNGLLDQMEGGELREAAGGAPFPRERPGFPKPIQANPSESKKTLLTGWKTAARPENGENGENA